MSDQCPGAPHDTVAACKSKSSRDLLTFGGVVAVSEPFEVKCRGTVPPDLQKEEGSSTISATERQVVISFVRSVFSAMALWA